MEMILLWLAIVCMVGQHNLFATNKINIYQLRTRFNEFELVSEDWKIPQKGLFIL